MGFTGLELVLNWCCAHNGGGFVLRTCHIFCAAGFTGLLETPADGDLVLAADGGLRHTEALGLTPHGILGDFDSLGYIPKGSTVFPVEKDDTDAMLAVRRGYEQGCRRFLLYGAMDGPRLDHTVANFQALAWLASRGAQGYLVGETYLAAVLPPGRVRFQKEAEGILSLFCLGAPVEGLTIRGLQYPLENHTLTPDFPLCVSNHFQAEPSEISWIQGLPLILWDRQNGLPSYTMKTGI